MIYVYRGREEFPAWLKAVEEEGLTVSPGGGASMIRVSRQRVQQLVADYDEVRAWAYYEGKGKRAEYLEVSVRDLLRYALRRGLIQSAEDVGLGFPRLREELATLKEELATLKAAV